MIITSWAIWWYIVLCGTLNNDWVPGVVSSSSREVLRDWIDMLTTCRGWMARLVDFLSYIVVSLRQSTGWVWRGYGHGRHAEVSTAEVLMIKRPHRSASHDHKDHPRLLRPSPIGLFRPLMSSMTLSRAKKAGVATTNYP